MLQRVEARPVLAGACAELVYLVGLVVTPLAAAHVGSLVLVLATGPVGGNVAGWLVDRPERATATGFGAGVLGGGAFAGLFWYMMLTPGAARGAFRALAYLLATAVPSSAFVAAHGRELVAGAAVLGWVVIALGSAHVSRHAARHPPRLFGRP